MENIKQQNGVFTTSQEDLTRAVYDTLIYKQRAKKISQEISKKIKGLEGDK
jgi:hypothetical protein